MKFSDLQLHPELYSGIEKLGFDEMTPVQEMTMPHILEGRDVAGLAQTGTGKTAAFLIPIMERIVRARLNPDELNDEEKAMRLKRMFPDWRANEFILCLVPTRELAEQVYENVLKLKGNSNLRAVSIYGGVSYDKQKEGLRNGVEFVIATPGRLIDLYKENLLDLKQVRAIVFDEADRMFDMGFKDDMKFILQRVPKDRQFMVFSATLNLDVLNTAYQFGANPVEVNVSRDQAKAENVEDKIFHVGQEEKGPHLLSLLRKHRPRQAIIFSNFKMNVPRLTQFLNENGLPAVGISSLLTQSQRNRVMEQFKGAGDQNILVATDVAARGLDVKGVDMVVNFELPDDPENYVHRIGRTGRAGEKGIAFSLVSDRDVDALSRVEQYLKHRVEIGFLEETELVKEFKAMPRAERESRFAGGSGGRSDRGPRPGGRDGGQRAGGPRSESGAPRDGARDGGGRDGGRRGGRSGRGPDRGGDRPNDRPNDRAANGAASDAAPRAGAAPMNGEGRPHSSARPQRGPDGRSSEARGGRGRNNGSRGAAQGPSQGASRPGSSAAAAGSPNSRHGSRPNSRAPHGQNGNGSRGPSRPNVGGKPSAQVGKPTASANSNASIGKKVGSFFKRLFGG